MMEYLINYTAMHPGYFKIFYTNLVLKLNGDVNYLKLISDF